MPGRKRIARYFWWQVHPRLAIVLAVVLVLVAVGGGYYLWPRPVHAVYITDGSHLFSEDVRHIENLIQQENQRVKDSGEPYVTIGFVDTMDPVPGVDVITRDSVRHDLEGAYLAQLAWNKPIGKPPVPLVQLLLVDVGSLAGKWAEAAAAVRERVDGGDHLVAVAGLGVSIDNTRNFVTDVGAHKIAIVAGAITGDEMTAVKDGTGPIPGMVRVAQTNSDQAAATVHYLDRYEGLPEVPTILLVQDQNSHDNFATSLGTSFVKTLNAGTARKYKVASPSMVFDSSLAQAGTILGANANKVCEVRADVVHFAGRGADLHGFLRGLAGRSCAATRRLTVVAPPDIARQAGKQLWQSGNDANMAVIFAGLTSSEMWIHDPIAAPHEISARFTDMCANCFPKLFPSETLADGNAVLSHDAVWTSLLAIRQLVAVNPVGSMPSASAVAQSLNQLKVDGASGWICSFDANHNPINKPIPILNIDQNGKLTYRALSSRSGTPPAGGCPS